MRLTNIAPLALMLGARSGMCYNAISYELSERPEDMIESSEQAPVADDKPRMAYLDVCALNRPLDDQSQMRIRLEADAVSLILSHVRSQSLALAVSPVHHAEVAANPDPSRRSHVQLLLQELGSQVVFDRLASRRRAEDLITLGMGTADAAHVALAEQVGCDFVTCDDRLLRQSGASESKSGAVHLLHIAIRKIYNDSTILSTGRDRGAARCGSSCQEPWPRRGCTLLESAAPTPVGLRAVAQAVANRS